MSNRPIAPTIEARHLAGDHRFTRVTQCPLCVEHIACAACGRPLADRTFVSQRGADGHYVLICFSTDCFKQWNRRRPT